MGLNREQKKEEYIEEESKLANKQVDMVLIIIYCYYFIWQWDWRVAN